MLEDPEEESIINLLKNKCKEQRWRVTLKHSNKEGRYSENFEGSNSEQEDGHVAKFEKDSYL